MATTIDVLPTSLPGWTQLAAVGVGAISGAAFAARRGFDVVGVLVLSVATGLGGLLLRDTLLQRGTSIVLTDGRYLIIAAIAAVIGFFFAGLVDRLEPVVVVLDALALGFLAAAGANAALAIQLPPSSAVFIGAATAAGGLVLRDLLAGVAPGIMRPGVLIAAAAFIGALVFTVLVVYTGMARGQAQVESAMEAQRAAEARAAVEAQGALGRALAQQLGAAAAAAAVAPTPAEAGSRGSQATPSALRRKLFFGICTHADSRGGYERVRTNEVLQAPQPMAILW
jgi:uncharacterized membrane protein YeiH